MRIPTLQNTYKLSKHRIRGKYEDRYKDMTITDKVTYSLSKHKKEMGVGVNEDRCKNTSTAVTTHNLSEHSKKQKT